MNILLLSWLGIDIVKCVKNTKNVDEYNSLKIAFFPL